jgi:hypothetical protein
MMTKPEISSTRNTARYPQPAARARTGRHDARTARVRRSRGARSTLRMRVAEAFRAMAHGVDPRTAFGQTKAFYRTGGGEWTRALS